MPCGSKTCLTLVLTLAIVFASVGGPSGAGRASATGVVTVQEVAENPASEEATPSATRLRLSAPSTSNPKQRVSFRASLTTSEGVPVAGKTVVIERLAATPVVIGTGVTNSAGVFSASAIPTARIVVQARFAGDAEHLPSTSERRVVMVRVLFGRPWTHDKVAYPGQRLPARGSLWPRHASGSRGTLIVCDRYEKGRWVRRAVFSASIVNTTSGSSYRGVFKLPSSGTWRVRARHSDAGHALTLGPARTIIVKDWRKRYVGKKLGGFHNHKKMVAITIDDGPNKRTMQICSILEKYGAKGTFFFTRELLNNGNRWQARRAYDRGHEIANHTANHRMLIGSYRSSYSQAYLPMATIRASTGFDPIWVRAMGGGIDRTGMRAVVRTGQLYCNWSLDSYDSHRRYTPPSVLYRNVMRGINSGDVILIHQTHPETVQALPQICRELKRRGYKMVTLSELAANSTAR